MTIKEICDTLIILITSQGLLALLMVAILICGKTEKENKELQNKKLKLEIINLEKKQEQNNEKSEFIKAQTKLMEKRSKK